VWSLSSGGVVENNQPSTGAQPNAIMLLYYNFLIYEQVQSCSVYVFQNNNWNATTLPVNAPNPVDNDCPNQTIPALSVIHDSSGNAWTITSGQQVAENGVTMTDTADVILLMYFNGNMYHQNSFCGVWEYTSGSWNEVSMPFDAHYEIPASIGSVCPGLGGVWNTLIAEPGSSGDGAGLMLSSMAGPFYYETTIPSTGSDQCVGGYAGSLLLGAVSSDGGNYSVSGTGTYTAGSNCTLSSQSENYTGLIYPNGTIDLTATGAPQMSWLTATNSSAIPFFYQTSTLAMLAGTWTLPDGEVWTIDSTGDVKLTGTFGCSEDVLNVSIGTITLLSPTYSGSPIGAYNLYSLYIPAFDMPCDGNPEDPTTYARTGLVSLQDASHLLIGDSLTITGNGGHPASNIIVTNEVFAATLQ
jgi:hypothetical protein